MALGLVRRAVLVDALLADKDVEDAWQAATETGAHDGQWLTLAEQARAVRPADAPSPPCARTAQKRERNLIRLMDDHGL
ncbi:hypothetical protein ACFV8Z_08670 [Streptomyces sp. NPDC059837]|uniref:hypothetical protein n=1 Tax=Streptomyces sp. NPDC059837 TaxID=3346968 RepID=UPI0036597D88